MTFYSRYGNKFGNKSSIYGERSYHSKKEAGVAKELDLLRKANDKKDTFGHGTSKERPRTNLERFQLLLEEIKKPLEHPNLGGISFGYKQEFWHDKKWCGVNSRFQTCYVVKTKIWKPLGIKQEDQWQDFGDFLRVIDQGYKVMRYGRYLMDTRYQGEEGGLKNFYETRTQEDYKETIELFKKQFPWLKFREKENGFIEPNMNNEVIGGHKL
ncbi:MAG: hypothetical protein AABY22_10045 [Nanoarchaeota archaeon]